MWSVTAAAGSSSRSRSWGISVKSSGASLATSRVARGASLGASLVALGSRRDLLSESARTCARSGVVTGWRRAGLGAEDGGTGAAETDAGGVACEQLQVRTSKG